jgi:hypothetical protein
VAEPVSLSSPPTREQFLAVLPPAAGRANPTPGGGDASDRRLLSVYSSLDLYPYISGHDTRRGAFTNTTPHAHISTQSTSRRACALYEPHI